MGIPLPSPCLPLKGKGRERRKAIPLSFLPFLERRVVRGRHSPFCLSRKQKGEGWHSSSLLLVPFKGKGRVMVTLPPPSFSFRGKEGTRRGGPSSYYTYLSIGQGGREEGVCLPRTPLSLTFNFKVTNET